MSFQLNSDVWHVILNIMPECIATMLCTCKYFSTCNLRKNYLRLQTFNEDHRIYYEYIDDWNGQISDMGKCYDSEIHEYIIHTDIPDLHYKIPIDKLIDSNVRRLTCSKGKYTLQQDVHAFTYLNVDKLIFTNQCRGLRMLKVFQLRFHCNLYAYACDENVEHDLKILDLYFDNGVWDLQSNIFNVEMLILRFDTTKIHQIHKNVKILCLIGQYITITSEIQQQCDVYYFYCQEDIHKYEYPLLFYYEKPSDKNMLHFGDYSLR